MTAALRAGMVAAVAALALPALAPAGSADAPALIAKARAAVARGSDAGVLRLVAADRDGAFEAVEILLSDGEAPGSAMLAAIARHYEATYRDRSLVDRIRLFASWTPEQRAARAEALRVKTEAKAAAVDGRWDEAAAAFEASLPAFETLGDSLQAGRCLLNLATVAEKRGQGDRVLDYQAQARRAMRAAGDLVTEAYLAHAVAGTLLVRGDPAGARAAIEEALPTARTYGDRYLEGGLVTMLASIDFDDGRLDAALEDAERGLTLARDLDNPEMEIVARGIRAAVFSRRGEERRAIPELERCVSLAAGGGLDWRIPSTQRDLAIAYRRLGQMQRADTILRAALAGAERTESAWLRAQLNLDLADSRFEEGDFAEGLRFLEAAEALSQEAEWVHYRAAVHQKRAGAYFYLARYDEALAEGRLGIAATRSISDHQLEAVLERNQGIILHTLGDTEAGLAALERAAALFERSGDAISRADDLSLMGALRAERGDLAGGRAGLEQGLALLTAEAARPSRAAALADLAALELRAGGAGLAAGRRHLEEAESIFTARRDLVGIQHVAALRAQLELAAGNPASARAALERGRRESRGKRTAEDEWRLRWMEGAVREAEGDRSGAAQAYRGAVAEVERVRASAAAAPWRAALLEDRIQPYRALVRLLRRGGDLRGAYQVARAAKSRTFIESLTPPLLEEYEPRALPPDPAFGARSVVAVARLQARLREDEVLLDYFLDAQDPVVFVLTARSLTASPLALPADFEALAAVASYPGRPGRKDAAVTAAWRSAAARLGGILLDPARDAIAAARQVLVVPSGSLHRVPFAALPDGDGRPLVERRTLATLPAAEALLTRGRALPAASEAVLAVGDPAASLGEAALPGAADEARAVAARGGPGTRALLGADAGEAAFRTLAPSFDRIHIAAHGHLDRISPARSFLSLAAAGGGDGRLEAGEIAGLALRARTVVLSGCETGVDAGTVRGDAPGDERSGLVRAFLGAGALEVIAGLWEVEDGATARFLPEIYPLARHATSAAALAEVQRRLLRGELRAGDGAPLDHPFYWAGLVAFGAGPGPGSR